MTETKEVSLQTISSAINHFRKKGQFSDVTLRIKDKEFTANKIFLAAFSPFFKTMFSGSFYEAHERSVSLTTVDADAMEVILEYAYTAKIEVAKGNVESILHAAHFFQAPQLVDICQQFLGKNVNSENWLGMLSLAEVYSLQSLQQRAMQYLMENFTDICKEPDFLQLDPQRLTAILQNDSLCVKNESVVLDAVIRWLRFSEERKEHLRKVFEHIRLAHIQPTHLFLDCVEREEALRESEPVRKLVDKVKDYHSLPSRRLTNQSSITRRRYNSSQIETVRLCFYDERIRNVLSVHVTEDGWAFKALPKPLETLYYGFHWHSCNYQPSVMLTPLTRQTGPFQIFLFNSEKEFWMETAPFPKPMIADVGLTEADGFWYAIGGLDLDLTPDRHTPTDKVHRYDPSSKEWIEVASLIIAVVNPAVVSMSGALYAVGCGPHSQKLEIQEYQIYKNEWTLRPSFPIETTNFGHACALNRSIYVMCRIPENHGHHGKKNKALGAYNVDTMEWKICAELNHEFESGPVLLNGRVFVLSKDDENKYLEYYDSAHDSWTDCLTFKSAYYITSVSGPYLMNRNRTIDANEWLDLIRCNTDSEEELRLKSKK